VDGVPAISYHWDFGDGTDANGTAVIHAYTYADTFHVRLSVQGVDGITASSSQRLLVTGTLPGKFDLLHNRRYIQPSDDK
jgi:PKD repeat protein